MVSIGKDESFVVYVLIISVSENYFSDTASPKSGLSFRA